MKTVTKMPGPDRAEPFCSDGRPRPDPSADAGRVAALEAAVADLQARLADKEARFQYACDLSNQILWTTAPNGDVTELPALWETLTGLGIRDSLGAGWTRALHGDDKAATLARCRAALALGEPFEFEQRLVMRNGEARWFHSRLTPRRGPDGAIRCWYGTMEDRHDARLAEEALKASETLTRNILESTTDSVVVMDREWRITFMNMRGAEFVKLMRGGTVGDSFWDIYSEYRGSEYELRYQEAIDTGKPVRFDAYLPNVNKWLEIKACPTGDGLAVFFHDVTEARRASDTLVQLAHQDPLTGLANRAVFNQALGHAFDGRLERQTHILLLDLDQFKEVNDTLGHSVGDDLLRAVAGRFTAALGEGDVLARLGGDEFAVVHLPQSGTSDAEGLASALMAALAKPFAVDGVAIKLAASIGIASSSPSHSSENDLFRAADIALYRAKAEGRGVIRTFDAPMAERAQARQSMKRDLEVALGRGELRLVYQPIMDIATGQYAGAEALLRWRHPVQGEISPAEFIPLAEDTGLIVPLGNWVLSEACRTAACWPQDRMIAVNLSPVQIRDESLPLRVIGALAAAGLAAGRLELEITESVLLSENERNLAILHSLRKAGVRIALDDFGTGYSSLSYLRHFPFDKLKLDRCFVGDLGSSRQSQAIARAAGEMGQAFAMTTTAEGVETQQQFDWLRANGWSQAQGWFTGRPMEAAAIAELFAVSGECRSEGIAAVSSPPRCAA